MAPEGKGKKDKDKGEEAVLVKVGGYLAQVEMGDGERGTREYEEGGYVAGGGKKALEAVKKEHKNLKVIFFLFLYVFI